MFVQEQLVHSIYLTLPEKPAIPLPLQLKLFIDVLSICTVRLVDSNGRKHVKGEKRRARIAGYLFREVEFTAEVGDGCGT